MNENHDRHDEVIVIGGGAAGLSAGLTLARARRAVTVIDGGAPRNAPAAGIHGLLANEGIAPAEYLARGRTEVTGYGGRVLAGQVRDALPDGDGFAVTLDDGTVLRSRALLVATGVRDVLPDLPGLAAHWGTSVLHCPYCHGWEVRDRRIGILGTGPLSWMQALMFHQWSDDVVLLAGDADPAPDEVAKLEAVGIEVVRGRVAEVLDDAAGALTGVRLADGTAVEVDALAVHSRIEANVGIIAGLGLPLEENQMGTVVPSDADGSTAVPGVWVAGNLRDQAAQVTAAAADGVLVAARLNLNLTFADADRAVEERRVTA
ncbi:NAD(P)/FAD-dependent oxidoreductase [Gordonia caeni]|uniref:NAD(P)/FAD-dependent oxidoreductase n=1 Tax=Gordonia caeni TaxID=1007097 RepID=A0ABP7P3F9_9ACTN